MSYDFLLFNRGTDSVDPQTFGENSMSRCISSANLRDKISELYRTTWYGVGDEFCWGQHHESTRYIAEFKIFGGEKLQSNFSIDARWEIVITVSKALLFWIYDPQAGVFYDEKGMQIRADSV
jgi:hypothetical protein